MKNRIQINETAEKLGWNVKWRLLSRTICNGEIIDFWQISFSRKLTSNKDFSFSISYHNFAEIVKAILDNYQQFEDTIADNFFIDEYLQKTGQPYTIYTDQDYQEAKEAILKLYSELK